MQKNRFISLVTVSCATAVLLTGCSGITGQITLDSPSDGKYATQYANSATEYYIYLSKQASVYTNQLTTYMIQIADGSTYELLDDALQQSIDTMQDVLDEVTVTVPSVNAEDDRDSMILAMQLAIEHMTGYRDTLERGGDVSGFKDDFQNDFNAITALAGAYPE